MTHQPLPPSVLWHIILLLAIAASVQPARAQVHSDTTKSDTTKADSLHHATFGVSGNANANIRRPRRTIDVALTGGAGYYLQGDNSSFQPHANADFFAQTSDLDLTAGFHWGFSDPSTKSLTVGLRFPLIEGLDETSGFFADAGLLFTDNGNDTDAFSTGIRAALAERVWPFEFRIAGELRRFPFSGEQTQAWVGIEAGFFINLLRAEVTDPTRKDSLHAALRYIATSAELDDLDNAQSNEDIDLWFDKFWRARNVTGSPRNEEQEEYMRRVAVANQRYGTPRTMGVSTDMGRVLLLYGEPDQVETGQSTILMVGADRRFLLWIDHDRVRGYRTALFLFMNSVQGNETLYMNSGQGHVTGVYEGHGEFRQIYSNIPGEPSEGIPADLPETMISYIQSFQ